MRERHGVDERAELVRSVVSWAVSGRQNANGLEGADGDWSAGSLLVGDVVRGVRADEGRHERVDAEEPGRKRRDWRERLVLVLWVLAPVDNATKRRSDIAAPRRTNPNPPSCAFFE